jgi:hypothetical protein
MVVTFDEVKELLEGRGFRPGEEEMAPSIFNVVLERLMQERRVESYDDLYDLFTEAGYDMDFETFLDACDGANDAMSTEFVRGVVDVLELDAEEEKAYAWAHLWGTK